MKYRARFSGPSGERTREVEILLQDRRVEVGLDGKRALYDAVSLGAGAYSILAPDGRHVDVTVHRNSPGVRVHVGAAVFDFELLDELTARALLATGARAGRHAADLKAAIPGRVLRVLVAPGDDVEAGMPLLVLEAMKMENEVRARDAGRVRSVEVQPGQAVGTGDVLVRFEGS